MTLTGFQDYNNRIKKLDKSGIQSLQYWVTNISISVSKHRIDGMQCLV